MVLVLLLTLAVGAFAATAFVPGREWYRQRAAALLGGWAFLVLVLQVMVGDGSRTGTAVFLLVLLVVAAVPLVLAAREQQRTGWPLGPGFRGPVVAALGVFISSAALLVTTLAAAAVTGGSADDGSSGSTTTTTTDAGTVPSVERTTTSEGRSGSTTTTEPETTTTTEPKGPTSVASATTSRESAGGGLDIALEGYRTTKDSVSLSFSNDAGLLIIFDAGGLGELSGDYRITATRSSVESVVVQIAVTQSQETDISVLADGVVIATCHPAGDQQGSCDT